MNEGNFILREKKGIKYYTIPTFDKTGLVKNIFTTRIKGVSEKPYNSLNLGLNNEDNLSKVKDNFKILCDAVDISTESLVFSNQVHGTNIKVINEKDNSKCFLSKSDSDGVDGLITNKKGLTLCTFYADCVPIYFLDTKKEVIGLAHAGWRGTVEKIAEKMIDIMEEKFQSDLNDIIVAIGPSIGPCCYEVDRYVYDKFNSNFTNLEQLLIPTDRDKWYLNLWNANVVILSGRGVPINNILVGEHCTSCNNDLFFSYRKENGKTGRMAALLQLV
ncbi:peptidoglycan editing factor PgeF [Sporosalibacterium faouarense]|uniref:peptidoglycan editing factor PgeF n=1 Tax=Sporosalibacterium faouarense TaxID=516123 RepID=UPI00141D4D86|nr:peptidoglycan editing factor PgeF [Sporosalibacterium faouarense]MTI49029.1 peptidoglycan editing factor PgeF [Bacillota bacterium]